MANLLQNQMRGCLLERNCVRLYFLDSGQYEKLTGKSLTLGDGEAALYVYRGNDSLTSLQAFGESSIDITQKIKEFAGAGKNSSMALNTYYIIFEGQGSF